MALSFLFPEQPVRGLKQRDQLVIFQPGAVGDGFQVMASGLCSIVARNPFHLPAKLAVLPAAVSKQAPAPGQIEQPQDKI